MDSAQQKGRLATADTLRAIACLLVVWFHFGVLAGDTSGLTWLRGTASIGWVGVQMFFVLSGFIVPYAMHRAGFAFPRDCLFFLARRLVRLDPPYFVASFGAALIAYVAAMSPAYRGPPANITWERSLAHVGYLNGVLGMKFYDEPCWTLGIEFQFYLLAAMLFPLVVSSHQVIRLTFHAAVLGTAYFACASGLVSMAIDDSACWILSWAPFFILGIASFQRFVGITRNGEYWLVSSAATLAGFATARIAGVWAGAATAVLLTYASFPGHRIIAIVAALSYSLYLTHSPIGERLIRLILRLGHSSLLVACALVAATTASLIAAYLLYRYTEVPALRWASSIRLSGHRKS